MLAIEWNGQKSTAIRVQKNLGPNTAKLARALTEYNPDPTWKLVEVQP
jgi:hypothetical protein